MKNDKKSVFYSSQISNDLYWQCYPCINLQNRLIKNKWTCLFISLIFGKHLVYIQQISLAMINYAISYKGTKTRMDQSGKLKWEDRRKQIIEKLRNFFSDKELNEIESSNRFILIDDSGNEVVYILAPKAF